MKKLFFLCLLAVPMVGQAMEEEKSDDSLLIRMIIEQEKTNKLLEEQTKVLKAQVLATIVGAHMTNPRSPGLAPLLDTKYLREHKDTLPKHEVLEMLEMAQEDHALRPMLDALPQPPDWKKIKEILEEPADQDKSEKQ